MKIEIRKPVNASYELFPRVVRLGIETTFRARGLGVESAWKPGTEYLIKVIPQEEICTAKTHMLGNYDLYDTLEATADEDGVLQFSYTCKREQLYFFRFVEKAENEWFAKGINLSVFCAADDLWDRTPMRGNTHAHTCFSAYDGHEDPVIAASIYRKAGFDYLAITDHHNSAGSAFAIEHMKDLPTEMAVYFGEEVHIPNAYIHAVNVGGRFPDGKGLSEYFEAHEAEVTEKVRKISEEAAPTLPEEIDPEDFAWRKWIADTIHENGGTAIIAHPFWNFDAHNTQNDMLRYLGKIGLYDAAEIVHGQDSPYDTEANMQLAFWNDLRAEGIFIPVVGSDDAHRRSYPWNYECAFNDAYTVIFARDPSLQGFSEAVHNGYSSAVESYGGAPKHVVGTYRMTRYTIFLNDVYFPTHDEFCFEEGCRLKEAYLGDKKALKTLERNKGRVKAYTDRFFGR